jgi:hypothetical protein
MVDGVPGGPANGQLVTVAGSTVPYVVSDVEHDDRGHWTWLLTPVTDGTDGAAP